MKNGKAEEKQGASALSFLALHKTGILYAFLMHLVLLIPAAMSPTFKKTFSNDVLDNAAGDWLPPLILTMLGVAFISGVASYLQRQCSLRLSAHIETDGAVQYVWNMLRSPSRDSDEFTQLSSIYAARSVAGILTRDLLGACFAVVSIAIYLPLMFREDIFMTFAALALTALSIALSFVRSMIFEKLSRSGINPGAAETAAKRIGLYGLMGVQAIKTSASEGRFFSALISARSISAAAGFERERDAAYEPLDNIGEIFFMNFLLFVSAVRITQRSFTIGSYLAFQAYASMLFEPIKTLVQSRGLFPALRTKLSRLYLSGEQELREHGKAELSGWALRVEDLPFPPGKISFYAPEGSRIVVAGGTGEERSALLRALAGLEPPSAGTVAIGGVPASAIDPQDRSRIVGYAARTPVFFNGTLRDNVSFWDKTIPDAAIIAVLALAGLPSKVFSEGLDRSVTEGGQNLSVGERRRIELARGLLYGPKILVVDDIFYRLDRESRAALENEFRSRSITLIASSAFPVATGEADLVVTPGPDGEDVGS